jgi:hypothetical protein
VPFLAWLRPGDRQRAASTVSPLVPCIGKGRHNVPVKRPSCPFVSQQVGMGVPGKRVGAPRDRRLSYGRHGHAVCAFSHQAAPIGGPFSKTDSLEQP